MNRRKFLSKAGGALVIPPPAPIVAKELSGVPWVEPTLPAVFPGATNLYVPTTGRSDIQRLTGGYAEYTSWIVITDRQGCALRGRGVHGAIKRLDHSEVNLSVIGGKGP